MILYSIKLLLLNPAGETLSAEMGWSCSLLIF